MLRTQAFRTIAVAAVCRRAAHPCLTLPARHLSTTPRRQAMPSNPDDFIKQVSEMSVFKKLSGNPQAVQSLKNIFQLMQEAGESALSSNGTAAHACTGVDLSTGKPPSTMQLTRLVLNRKFMKAMKQCMEEFKLVGIDLKSDVRALPFGRVRFANIPRRRLCRPLRSKCRERTRRKRSRAGSLDLHLIPSPRRMTRTNSERPRERSASQYSVTCLLCPSSGGRVKCSCSPRPSRTK
jgi:hypothetical protein